MANRSANDDGGDAPDTPQKPDRHLTAYQSRVRRPRWILHMQAVFWRFLMSLGMFFHRVAPPRPPKPAFTRVIPSKLSGKPGHIPLHFYVPKDYDTQKRLWTDRPKEGNQAAAAGEQQDGQIKDTNPLTKSLTAVSSMGQTIRRRSTVVRRWGGYPVIINFHGGGFTLGSAMDDARWCGTVVEECHAVVVSVDYRLAPEHHFPTAVEDGVDSVVWIHEHAEQLGIDREKIALSGFSSGGNMAFTVPLRLYDEVAGFPRDDVASERPTSKQKTERAYYGAVVTESSGGAGPSSSSATDNDSNSNASTAVAVNNASVQIIDPNEPAPSITRPSGKTHTIETIAEDSGSMPDVSIRCIIPWYPPVDYTRTREQRRATCRRPDQELPALFTDLFDESYLHPPDTISLDSPYLSPGVAPAALLRNGLPSEIIMHTCEWDMLLAEGELFRDRLTSPEIGKNLFYYMVEGVPHGWDKAPNPWKPTPGVREHYLRACKEIRRVMGPEKGAGGRPLMEREVTAGPSAAPRDTIPVVR